MMFSAKMRDFLFLNRNKDHNDFKFEFLVHFSSSTGHSMPILFLLIPTFPLLR
ncbi:hypothetical protein Syun_015275 [Stephania yunnanensis]|uniref:Uncharacterized protein n=1 Tax=Stephania yunnanensis TaxID=152371 RepID=A0AAP0JN27_9MAGN